MTMLHVFAVSEKPSAGRFKSPTTFWTSRNLPLHWEKPPAKTSLNKKRPIPPCSVLNAHIRSPKNSPKKRSPNWTPTSPKHRGCAKSPSSSSTAAAELFHERQITEAADPSPRRRTCARRTPPWNLQQDPRVIQIKRNARELQPHEIPEHIDLVVVDVSFISVTKVLPPAVLIAKPGATFLILVKPQFELRREDVGEGGIVKDPSLHKKAIASVENAATSHALEILGVSPSRITAVEGNQEFFLHARKIV